MRRVCMVHRRADNREGLGLVTEHREGVEDPYGSRPRRRCGLDGLGGLLVHVLQARPTQMLAIK